MHVLPARPEGGNVTYVIVDTKTGRVCGKPYDSRRKAREQAARLNRSCRHGRFRCEERPLDLRGTR